MNKTSGRVFPNVRQSQKPGLEAIRNFPLWSWEAPHASEQQPVPAAVPASAPVTPGTGARGWTMAFQPEQLLWGWLFQQELLLTRSCSTRRCVLGCTAFPNPVARWEQGGKVGEEPGEVLQGCARLCHGTKGLRGAECDLWQRGCPGWGFIFLLA